MSSLRSALPRMFPRHSDRGATSSHASQALPARPIAALEGPRRRPPTHLCGKLSYLSGFSLRVPAAVFHGHAASRGGRGARFGCVGAEWGGVQLRVRHVQVLSLFLSLFLSLLPLSPFPSLSLPLPPCSLPLSPSLSVSPSLSPSLSHPSRRRRRPAFLLRCLPYAMPWAERLQSGEGKGSWAGCSLERCPLLERLSCVSLAVAEGVLAEGLLQKDFISHFQVILFFTRQRRACQAWWVDKLRIVVILRCVTQLS